MSFISLCFYLYLAAIAGVFHLVPPAWRNLYLLLASYAFYLACSGLYLVLLLAATALSYGIGLVFAKPLADHHRRLWLWAGVGPIIGMLVFFKYKSGVSGIILPIGMSYYTFKLISYLLETYWDENEVEHNIVDFALYPAFAPQIVSGPIQRSADFFEQLISIKAGKVDTGRIEEGFRLILGGLMLKLLVGDRLSSFISVVDAAPATYTHAILMTTMFCYSLQLYADFAGYTNIALGIGKLFGIDGPANFNAPFAAANMQQFWRRWHMSLTTWVTDYVFLPTRMATRSFGDFGLVLSILLNMTLIGLWHGLSWTFLIFGVMNGIFLSVSALTLRERDRFFATKASAIRLMRTGAAIIITLFLFSFSQLFWRARSLDSALLHCKLLFEIVPAGNLTWTDIRTDIEAPVFVCMILAFFFGAGAPGLEALRMNVDRKIPNWVQYGFALLLISALSTEAGSSFIYGQF
jgi:D-alanyl-lipoteichoic acid acyltransferase DltB (MBOAT superfamily)